MYVDRIIGRASTELIAQRLAFSFVIIFLFGTTLDAQTIDIQSTPFERLKNIQSKHRDKILNIEGVFGIGIGKNNSDLVFHVLVDKSFQNVDLPSQLDGIPVFKKFREPPQLLHGRVNSNPASCGLGLNPPCHANQSPLPVPMGNTGSWTTTSTGGACSIGFKACDLGSKKTVFVTNSHCNVAGTACQPAFPGAPTSSWIHPGRTDVVGNPATNICIPAGTCDIIGTVSGNAAPSCGSNNNLTDASKVESSSAQTSIVIRDVGWPQAGAGTPAVGMLVQKSGRTTGLNTGVITELNVDIEVDQGAMFCCGPLTMHDQIAWQTINSNILPGDSGSALLSRESELAFQVVGLNWGNGGGFAYANHIDNVLSALNLSLNFFSCFADCLFSSIAATQPNPSEFIDLGHRFRKNVLESNPIGHKYANIYYQITDEAVRITKADPTLLIQTAKLLLKERDNIKSMINGKRISVDRSQIRDIDKLLSKFQESGSKSFSRLINSIRSDISNVEVLKNFSVSIKGTSL